MIHAVAAITVLAQQCASEVATEAVVPLVMTESGGDDLSINVNRGPRVRAGSAAEGAALVRRYMAQGYTVDVGLAQINSANFARLGVSVEQAFDPCTNLRLASSLLQESYGLASRHYSGLDAISAIGGPILRGRYKDAKKGDLAGTCASLCNGQGIVEAEIREKATAWLPDAMRFEGQEKAARTPLRSSFVDDETGIDPDEDEDTDLDTGDDAVIDHEEEEDFSQAA